MQGKVPGVRTFSSFPYLGLPAFLGLTIRAIPLFICREEFTLDKPLLTVDRQSGLVIVTPEGKEAQTTFKRLFYDEKRDESVVSCKPLTGRSTSL